MIMKSENTGKYYEPSSSIYIVNPRQANLYLKHHAELLDVIPGERLAFVFDKKETAHLYKLWLSGDLQ